MHTSDTHNELPHRADELQDAPKLQALRSQLREEAPRAYFERFGERLTERLEDESILAEAPELSKLGKSMRPDVPEGYFASFHKHIMNTVAPAPVRQLWQRPVVWAVAAGVALPCALLFMYQPTNAVADEEAFAWNELEEQELLAMVSLVGAEAEDVASVFSVDDISFEDIETFEEAQADELLESLDLSEEDILDILNETYQ